jgi:YVTN family beta-propeller protein
MKLLNTLLAVTLLHVGLPSAVHAEYKLLKTIPVTGDGRWDYLMVDEDAHRLYIPRTTHTQVIDLDSGKAIADWPDTTGVHGVALVRDKSLAFTSNGRSDSVSVFDLTTNKKIADVKTGTGPDAIIYDESSGKVLAMLSMRHLLRAEVSDLEQTVWTLVADTAADGPGG